jgi:leader peptidase (prepilin peptidase) / N-methyltransferase
VDLALVVGCGLGGAVAGGALDTLTGRIVRPAPAAHGDGTSESDPERGSTGAVPAPVPATSAAFPRARVAPASEVVLSAALTALTFGVSAARLGAVPVLAGVCALLGGLIASSVVDVRLGILPRSIVYPTLGALAVGLLGAAAVDHQWRSLLHAGIGGVGSFVVFFGLWWVYPKGIGLGDVRVAGLMGAGLAWFGFGQLYVGFLAAFGIGAVVGLALMLRHGTGRKTRLAFGPALCAGTAIGIWWGAWIVHLWLHH